MTNWDLFIWVWGAGIFCTIAVLLYLVYTASTMPDPTDVCKSDCDSLNLSYFRYNAAYYGQDSCWCKEGEYPRQVW